MMQLLYQFLSSIKSFSKMKKHMWKTSDGRGDYRAELRRKKWSLNRRDVSSDCCFGHRFCPFLVKSECDVRKLN